MADIAFKAEPSRREESGSLKRLQFFELVVAYTKESTMGLRESVPQSDLISL